MEKIATGNLDLPEIIEDAYARGRADGISEVLEDVSKMLFEVLKSISK